MNLEDMSVEQLADLEREWRDISRTGNYGDFLSGQYLDGVLRLLSNKEEQLRRFIRAILRERHGKRISKLVRFARAHRSIPEQATWIRLGGRSVVVLSRVDGRTRPRILRLVEEHCEKRGHHTMSEGAFRALLVDALGADAYARLRIEEPNSRNETLVEAARQGAVAIRNLRNILDLLPALAVHLDDEGREVMGVDRRGRRVNVA